MITLRHLLPTCKTRLHSATLWPKTLLLCIVVVAWWLSKVSYYRANLSIAHVKSIMSENWHFNFLESFSNLFFFLFFSGTPCCRSYSFSAAWLSWFCFLPLLTENGGNPLSPYQTLKLSTGDAVTTHSRKHFLDYTSFISSASSCYTKQISDKRTALYRWMAERKMFLICQQDICLDTLKCARLKYQGN